MKKGLFAAGAVLAVGLAFILGACSSNVAKKDGVAEPAKLPRVSAAQSATEQREELYDAFSWNVTTGEGVSLVAADVLHGADPVEIPLPTDVVKIDTTIICREGGTFYLQYMDGGETVVRSDAPCDGTLQALIYSIPIANGTVVLTPPADTDWSYQVVVTQ